MSYYASFFDFDELGNLGVFLVIDQSPYDFANKTTLQAWFNFVETDCFFLKALALNGIQDQSFSTLYYGGSFECDVSDLSGNRRLVKTNQLTHPSYTALQLPFTYIGLNRTNNYVENFVVGVSFSGGNTNQWTPIIPNSQLIVFVNPPTWGLDIFINPTKHLGVIIVIAVIILILLGLLIIYYHHLEKEDDMKTGDQFLHHMGKF